MRDSGEKFKGKSEISSRPIRKKTANKDKIETVGNKAKQPKTKGSENL